MLNSNYPAKETVSNFSSNRDARLILGFRLLHNFFKTHIFVRVVSLLPLLFRVFHFSLKKIDFIVSTLEYSPLFEPSVLECKLLILVQTLSPGSLRNLEMCVCSVQLYFLLFKSIIRYFKTVCLLGKCRICVLLAFHINLIKISNEIFLSYQNIQWVRLEK